MPLHIDRVDTEMQVMRSAATDAPTGVQSSAGDTTLGALRGDNALKDRLRPIVLEIMHDELDRMRRKVGSP